MSPIIFHAPAAEDASGLYFRTYVPICFTHEQHELKFRLIDTKHVSPWRRGGKWRLYGKAKADIRASGCLTLEKRTPRDGNAVGV